MTTPGEGFELPADMREATPDDVQSVLDAIDVLLISAETREANHGEFNSLIDSDEVLEGDILRRIFLDVARRNRMTPDQLAFHLKDMHPYDLNPVDDMESFQVRRFSEAYQGTVGMVIRDYGCDRIEVAHIRESEEGLRLFFGYDLPDTSRATVADCEEMKRQLGMTFVLQG